MSNFFRKIPKSLVVLVLVLAVFTGYASASEGDTPTAPSADVADTPVVDSTPADTTPDSSPDTPTPDDTPDSSPDDAPDGSGDYGGGGFGGYDALTVSGADVTVNVQRHDTLSVSSVASGVVDGLDSLTRSQGDAVTPTLAETIRSLFGTYTPRTQTVTTYYDGQPISTEEQYVPGLAGLDWEWLSGAALFALITFCLFRLLGGILKNG